MSKSIAQVADIIDNYEVITKYEEYQSFLIPNRLNNPPSFAIQFSP